MSPELLRICSMERLAGRGRRGERDHRKAGASEARV